MVRPGRWLSSVAATALLVAGGASAATAAVPGRGSTATAAHPTPMAPPRRPGQALLRQLYGGHPPAGRVAADNVLIPPPWRPIHGYVILIHGGGWVQTGFVDTASAGWFNAHGWATYSIDYRAGWPSLADTVAAYDHLRHLVGQWQPICVVGSSAGGTLAMQLAAIRPDVSCVISQAGIADIFSMIHQCAYGHHCGVVDRAARYTFWPHGPDPEAFWSFSPVRFSRLIEQPLLMAGSSHDPVVDEPAQLSEMKRARPQTTTMLLAGSNVQPPNFIHASITASALRSFQRAELRLLNTAAPGL